MALPMAAMQTVAITFELGVVPIVVALIAGVAPMTAVIISSRKSGRKMEEIHVLVNSRLTQALEEIESLKVTLSAKEAVLAEKDVEK